MAQTPDQELTYIIASALVSEGLVMAEKRDELVQRLSTGTIREEDWRLLIKKPVVPESKEQSHGEAD